MRRRKNSGGLIFVACVSVTSCAFAVDRFWDGGAGDTDWLSLSGANFAPDGVPGAGDRVIFDNSIVTPLPAQTTINAATISIQSLAWNSTDASDLRNATGDATNSLLDLVGSGGPLISVTAGSLGISRNNASTGTGTLALRLAAGTINVGSNATLDINTNIGESAAGVRITKTGGGLLDLSGFTHTFTGGVAVLGGTVNFTGTGNVGTLQAANTIELDGGAMRLSGAFNSTATARGVLLGAGGGTIDVTAAGAGTFSGPFSGTGRLHKTGAGTLWVSSTASTFSGGVHILEGTYRVGSAVQLGALPGDFVANYLQIDGGTLLLLGNTALGSNRGTQIDAEGATFDIGATNSPSLLGVISGPGAITKVGGGTLTFGGANTFDGALSVQTGMLIATGTSALGSTAGATTIAAGAALAFNNNVQHDSPEPVTVSGTGPAGSGAIENLGGSNLFAGPLTLAGDTTVGVTAGDLTLSGGISGGASNLTVGGAGTLTVKRIRTTGGVTLNVPVTHVLTGRSTANTSIVGALTLGGSSQLDLADQDLIVDYTGSSPLADIRGKILAGYAGGSWNGNGISSSAAAANPSAGLGYAEAAALGIGSFSGQSIDADAVLVRYTLRGDANIDGTVNIGDFSLLASNFNSAGDWAKGDFNYDLSVNIGDFSLLASNFNQVLAGSDGARGAVPEPASAVGALGAAMLLRRRRN